MMNTNHNKKGNPVTNWLNIPFGKFKEKKYTLPRVVLADPDYFFWAIESGAFERHQYIKPQALDVFQKARNIAVKDSNCVVEYFINPSTYKFAGFHIVPRDREPHLGSSPTFRKDRVDLSFPRSLASYDKTGGKLLMESVKYHYFGKTNARITNITANAFFDTPTNFIA